MESRHSTSCFGCRYLQAMHQRSCQRQSSLVVVLDHLTEADFWPLIDVINNAMCSADVDAVDIVNESSCTLTEDQILSLICAANEKLCAVSFQDLPFRKHFLRDLFQSGLACRVLKLSSPSLQKLDMVGRFVQLQKLDLDYCSSLTRLHKDCFCQMPNLMQLSVCGSRLADLWTTAAALWKLPSLVQLRFQNCSCCEDTGPCPAYSSRSGCCVSKTGHNTQETIQEFRLLYDSYKNSEVQHDIQDPAEGRVGKFSDHLQSLSLLDLSSGPHLGSKNGNSKNKGPHDQFSIQDGYETLEKDINSAPTDAAATRKYISHHPSPICFEKHYRDFMISYLPRLEVLDNIPIGRMDREVAKLTFSKFFESLPYKRWPGESVAHILHNREIASGGLVRQISSKSKHSSLRRRNQYGFSRSLCAAKLAASPWPLLLPVSTMSCTLNEEIRSLRPRQFEYHPSDPSRMAFGTLDGEVVVINHENGKIFSYTPPFGTRNSILGLCWLKSYPSKVLAGSDNGLLRLFDISKSSSRVADSRYDGDFITFDKFEQLTSVHINSTDQQLLVSGYTRNVALYDIGTGKRQQLFTNLHQEPINVAKFAHHSPFMFATSSFDRDVKMWDTREGAVRPCYSATSSRGNVMVCFSPDDHYLLVSAVDNEVKQFLAVDGRLHTDFGIASSGSSHNYTRSYYMNGRDYIITGSSDEHLVRVCCAQTGRRLRDIYFEGRGSEKAAFVQSLRSDPFRPFNMSILASYAQSSSKCEIIKINMLARAEDDLEDTYPEQFRQSFILGG
ncbi:hypothetical protein Cgig2_011086 [Carnegiea gigantea]|uniref:DWD hypersensitive to UV-B 1 N-terminal domain-containing protein n=1 Tax=Carnegiea gigantea TaxID=171969 RepID=A0A9Q1JMV9_9CARY|nr:hypothetical protein Cgig2_011086 [Carnegiea gigantea]